MTWSSYHVTLLLLPFHDLGPTTMRPSLPLVKLEVSGFVYSAQTDLLRWAASISYLSSFLAISSSSSFHPSTSTFIVFQSTIAFISKLCSIHFFSSLTTTSYIVFQSQLGSTTKMLFTNIILSTILAATTLAEYPCSNDTLAARDGEDCQRLSDNVNDLYVKLCSWRNSETPAQCTKTRDGICVTPPTDARHPTDQGELLLHHLIRITSLTHYL